MPLPQHCPSPRELDDLELLLSGALAPYANFTGPLTLELPEGMTRVELVDPEGLPLAVYDPAGLSRLSAPAYGPFRSHHLGPTEVAERWPDALTVPVTSPLTQTDLDDIERARGSRPVVLLALTGQGTPQGLTSAGLVRASLAASTLIPESSVVAAPLASHDDATVDLDLARIVTSNYAPGPVLRPTGHGELPDPVRGVVDEDQPYERGLVLFFTGLSGSGKSTIARALHDAILERGRKTVTSLDGDVVRRHLSAGLTFSREDRETNIRRIGWVAAEIARHRGVALCSPIAPFDETRRAVRAMVEQAGGLFFLIHVATPLEECERRDRKGLYARARAGEIPDFTGISSPYEEPQDADLRIDTTGRSLEDCLTEVLGILPSCLLGDPVPGMDRGLDGRGADA